MCLNNALRQNSRCHVSWSLPLTCSQLRRLRGVSQRRCEGTCCSSSVGASVSTCCAIVFWLVPGQSRDPCTGLKPWFRGIPSNKDILLAMLDPFLRTRIFFNGRVGGERCESRRPERFRLVLRDGNRPRLSKLNARISCNHVRLAALGEEGQRWQAMSLERLQLRSRLQVR